MSKDKALPSDSLLSAGNNPIRRRANSHAMSERGSVRSYRSYRSAQPKLRQRQFSKAPSGSGRGAPALGSTREGPTLLKEEKRPVGLCEVLRNPRVLQALSGTVFGASCQGLLEACLEPYLETFNLSITTIGLTFLGLSVPYFLASPIWGHTCDHWVNPKIIQPIGHVLVAVGG